MAALSSSEESFMETWQIIALIVVIAGAIGFFVWKKKQGD
jgi:hypothetical protein